MPYLLKAIKLILSMAIVVGAVLTVHFWNWNPCMLTFPCIFLLCFIADY